MDGNYAFGSYKVGEQRPEPEIVTVPKEQWERMVVALRFYANSDNYTQKDWISPSDFDGGRVARKALEGVKNV